MRILVVGAGSRALHARTCPPAKGVPLALVKPSRTRSSAPRFGAGYFQDLAGPSIFAVLATVSYGTRPFATLTTDPGLEEMPWVLASGLTVHYEAPVARIERDEAGAALGLDNGTVVEGDRIVLAVPAPAAASLVGDPSPLEAELLSILWLRASGRSRV